jgi:HEAT repeat protein
MDFHAANEGGDLYSEELIQLGDAPGPSAVRAMAVRALGLVRKPALQKPMARWLADADSEVRASAALLLADFPESELSKKLAELVKDSAHEVRACAAEAIGCLQRADFAPLLAQMLSDPETNVRRFAAMSLLSFSPTDAGISGLFKASLDKKEFDPLFLNALAGENPEPYLPQLARAIEEKSYPSTWWGGQTPAFTSWKILFKYLKAQFPSAIRDGKFDRYLDALEKVGHYSSSEPRDIYAFYLQREMTERAAKFRASANKSAGYDLDYYFKQVDQNPANYQGN